jgi:hypothetical protein
MLIVDPLTCSKGWCPVVFFLFSGEGCISLVVCQHTVLATAPFESIRSRQSRASLCSCVTIHAWHVGLRTTSSWRSWSRKWMLRCLQSLLRPGCDQYHRGRTPSGLARTSVSDFCLRNLARATPSMAKVSFLQQCQESLFTSRQDLTKKP